MRLLASHGFKLSRARDSDNTSEMKCKNRMGANPRILYLGFGEDTTVDLKIMPGEDRVRVLGFNNLSCLDFTINVCRILDFKPSDYTLMVCDQNLNICSWHYASPSSSIESFIQTESFKSNQNSCRQISLVLKSYANELLVSSQSNSHPPKQTVLISGAELLKQLGDRVLVYLPRERKLVIRAHLDRPLSEAFEKVCAIRNLRPDEFILRNPRTGGLLDPASTFLSQCISEFELKACSGASPNRPKSVNMDHEQQSRTNESLDIRTRRPGVVLRRKRMAPPPPPMMTRVLEERPNSMTNEEFTRRIKGCCNPPLVDAKSDLIKRISCPTGIFTRLPAFKFPREQRYSGLIRSNWTNSLPTSLNRVSLDDQSLTVECKSRVFMSTTHLTLSIDRSTLNTLNESVDRRQDENSSSSTFTVTDSSSVTQQATLVRNTANLSPPSEGRMQPTVSSVLGNGASQGSGSILSNHRDSFFTPSNTQHYWTLPGKSKPAVAPRPSKSILAEHAKLRGNYQTLPAKRSLQISTMGQGV